MFIVKRSQFLITTRKVLANCTALALGLLLAAGFLFISQILVVEAAPTLTVSLTDAVPVIEGNPGNITTSIYTVTLSAEAATNVTITYKTTDGSAIGTQDYTAVPTTTIVIPSGEISATVYVTVTGDYFDEDDQNFYVDLLEAQNAEYVESGSRGEGVILDDDSSGFYVDPVQLFTSETGASDDFWVSLTSQPTDTVTVTLSIDPDYIDEGIVSISTLIFPSELWNQPITVTVTGLDDSEDDGDVSYPIVLDPAISNDFVYNGRKPDDVTVENHDNEERVFLPLVINNYSSGYPIIFWDDFSSSSWWDVIAGGIYTSYIRDGWYHLQQKTPNYNVRTIAPDEFEMPDAYSAEVDAYATMHPDTEYGIIFDWLDEARFYRFIVAPRSNQYYIQKFATGYETLASGSLPQGFQSNQSARLKVERDRASIRVYINDQLLTEINDTTYPKGRAGFIIIAPESLNTEYAEVAFDNFVIRELPHSFLNVFASSNSRIGWDEIAGGVTTAHVANGEYYLRQDVANYNIRSVAPINGVDIPNAYLVETIAYTVNNINTKYGIIFDWSNTGAFYRFVIDPGGNQYLIQIFSNGYQTIHSGELPPGFVSTQPHRLSVKRDGTSIFVYVDDTALHPSPIMDNTYPHGQVGLIMIAPVDMVTGYAEAAFDDFVVTKIP